MNDNAEVCYKLADYCKDMVSRTIEIFKEQNETIKFSFALLLSVMAAIFTILINSNWKNNSGIIFLDNSSIILLKCSFVSSIISSIFSGYLLWLFSEMLFLNHFLFHSALAAQQKVFSSDIDGAISVGDKMAKYQIEVQSKMKNIGRTQSVFFISFFISLALFVCTVAYIILKN